MYITPSIANRVQYVFDIMNIHQSPGTNGMGRHYAIGQIKTADAESKPVVAISHFEWNVSFVCGFEHNSRRLFDVVRNEMHISRQSSSVNVGNVQ